MIEPEHRLGIRHGLDIHGHLRGLRPVLVGPAELEKLGGSKRLTVPMVTTLRPVPSIHSSRKAPPAFGSRRTVAAPPADDGLGRRQRRPDIPGVPPEIVLDDNPIRCRPDFHGRSSSGRLSSPACCHVHPGAFTGAPGNRIHCSLDADAVFECDQMRALALDAADQLAALDDLQIVEAEPMARRRNEVIIRRMMREARMVRKPWLSFGPSAV